MAEEEPKETNSLKEILAGKNILIVEDEEQIRDLLRCYLGNMNKANITLAVNGQDAWNILNTKEGQKPDLIITDWEMGPLEAPELIVKIKADERLAKIPIILMSGRQYCGATTQAEIDGIAQKIGADIGLAKPFSKLLDVKSLAENLLRQHS